MFPELGDHPSTSLLALCGRSNLFEVHSETAFLLPVQLFFEINLLRDIVCFLLLRVGFWRKSHSVRQQPGEPYGGRARRGCLYVKCLRRAVYPGIRRQLERQCACHHLCFWSSIASADPVR